MENDIWQKRAPVYDKLEWVHRNDFLDFFVNVCEVQKNYSALDIGCGTGIVGELLSKQVRLFIGIDNSHFMIREAKRKISTNDRCGYYVIQDAQMLGFPDNTFDLVTARMCFHHIDNVEKGLRETYRVLKPGGRLVLCEGVPPDELVKKRYEEIFALKEKRHTFLETDLVNYLIKSDYKNIKVTPYYMQRVSLINWLCNSATEESVSKQIIRLHQEADAHFKDIYRIEILEHDIIMDWKFIILTGKK